MQHHELSQDTCVCSSHCCWDCPRWAFPRSILENYLFYCIVLSFCESTLSHNENNRKELLSPLQTSHSLHLCCPFSCRCWPGLRVALLQHDSQRNKILHVPRRIADSNFAVSGASSHRLHCHYRLDSPVWCLLFQQLSAAAPWLISTVFLRPLIDERSKVKGRSPFRI